MKDRILLAGLIGGISVVSGEIITAILVALGAGQYRVFELNSLIVTNSRPSFWMGFLINFIIGVHAGVVFYLLLGKLGAEHVVAKCTMGSLLLWLVFELFFTVSIENKDIPLRPVSDHFVHIAGTAAYGATVGVLLKALLFNRAGRGTRAR